MSTIPPKPRTITGDLALVDDPPARDSQPVITPLEGDDLPALVRHMRLLAHDVRDLVTVVRGTVVPALRRLEERQGDEERYTADLIRGVHERIDEVQAQIAGLK